MKEGILNTGAATDPKVIAKALLGAVEEENVDMVTVILNSGAAIDPKIIAEVLLSAVEQENVDMVKVILHSGVIIEPREVGKALLSAVGEDMDMVEAILNLGTAIDPKVVAEALLSAMDRGHVGYGGGERHHKLECYCQSRSHLLGAAQGCGDYHECVRQHVPSGGNHMGIITIGLLILCCCIFVCFNIRLY